MIVCAKSISLIGRLYDYKSKTDVYWKSCVNDCQMLTWP